MRCSRKKQAGKSRDGISRCAGRHWTLIGYYCKIAEIFLKTRNQGKLACVVQRHIKTVFQSVEERRSPCSHSSSRTILTIAVLTFANVDCKSTGWHVLLLTLKVKETGKSCWDPKCLRLAIGAFTLQGDNVRQKYYLKPEINAISICSPHCYKSHLTEWCIWNPGIWGLAMIPGPYCTSRRTVGTGALEG